MIFIGKPQDLLKMTARSVAESLMRRHRQVGAVIDDKQLSNSITDTTYSKILILVDELKGLRCIDSEIPSPRVLWAFYLDYKLYPSRRGKQELQNLYARTIEKLGHTLGEGLINKVEQIVDDAMAAAISGPKQSGSPHAHMLSPAPVAS